MKYRLLDEETLGQMIEFLDDIQIEAAKGKYKDDKWLDILDANWLSWVAQKSKVEWQRELAQKELKRRSK